ncbi:MAG TPA: methyl-accepting chemotaxis protein, partial [Ectothiorhodospiraceae bacterium]|nr:methyl-accepting chemotaxis protein [Ectothiorhodospiraceae bacterium]
MMRDKIARINKLHSGSLKRQIIIALSLLLLLNGFTLGYIIWSLEERQREHKITAEYGQFRLTVQMLQHGIPQFNEGAPLLEPMSSIANGIKIDSSIKKHINALDSIGKKIKGVESLVGDSVARLQPNNYEQEIIYPVLDMWQQFKKAWLNEELERDGYSVLAERFKILNATVTKSEENLHDLITYRVHSQRQLLYWSVFANMLIGLLIFVWFYQRVLIPMNKADQGVRRISSGEFGYQIPVIYEDEIGRMGSSFN